MQKKHLRGISLIEVLIVMVIIGILAAIAYPSYTTYVTRTRRHDGQTALMDLATRMERYYAEHNSYAGASLGKGNPESDILSSPYSPEGWYELRIRDLSPTTYTLEAKPRKGQIEADTACAVLTINHLGVKGRSGSAGLKECW